ncbi:hypothetical protein ACOTCG_07000 [Achromobacter xylosoxidans]
MSRIDCNSAFLMSRQGGASGPMRANLELRLRLLEDVRGRYLKSFQGVGALLKSGERDAAR